MKKYIGGFLILIFLYASALLSTQFLWPIILVSSSPQTGSTSVSPDTQITMTFNNSLPGNVAGQLQSSNPNVLKFAQISIGGNVLTITPAPNLAPDAEFSFSLNTRSFSPFSRAVIGEMHFKTANQSPAVTRNFSTVEQQQEYDRLGYLYVQDFQTRLETVNPLIRALPHITDGFRVDYGVSDKTKLTVYYPVSVRVPSAMKGTLKTPEEVLAELQKQEGLALDWIRSQGFDPATLDIRMQKLDINQIQAPQ